MKIEQLQWTPQKKWNLSPKLNDDANLVFIFAERALLKESSLLQEIKSFYPKAHLFGCSTSGEIHGDHVYDETMSVTALHFEQTKIQAANLHMSEVKNSFEAGEKLAQALEHKDLTHVLVLSNGLNINGSELVKGLTKALPEKVTISGGLAGDQARFQETIVVLDKDLANDSIAVIGLYGSNIEVASASVGGWDAFGPERRITKAKENILFELDGQSALQLYKTYLGDYAKELPGSALLFPLSLRTSDSEQGVVRTILAVDNDKQTMTFAGDMPEGASVRFMKANFNRLVEGASDAAQNSTIKMDSIGQTPEFALLISCVGRKLVLKQRVEDEIEGVRNIFGPKTLFSGFYSYGEISPFTPNAKCELHNQTMTITTFSEKGKKAA